MRISDIIAYLGKDRQDAERTGIVSESEFSKCEIGEHNAEIINNLIVNILENSYGKNYIMLDERHFKALKMLKDENYRRIYRAEEVEQEFDRSVKPMMEELFEKLLTDVKNGVTASPIFEHHINLVESSHYERQTPYAETDAPQLVTDYIASMTDDYFIDLHKLLIPSSKYGIVYKGYFD